MTTPSLRDRLRPIELIGIAMVLAAFTGVGVAVGTRQPPLAVIAGGLVFIVSLLILAMLALMTTSGTPEDRGSTPVLHPRREPDDPPND